MVMYAFLMQSGCGSDEVPVEEHGWNVEEKVPSEKIHLGLYELDLVIERDECQPSLRSITERVPNWPPEQEGVGGSVSGSQPFVSFSTYQLRTGGTFDASVLTNKYGYPPRMPDFPEEWGTSFMGKPCLSDAREEGDLAVDISSKFDGQQRLVVRYEIAWNRPNLCEEERDRLPFIPPEACREAYTLIYTLVEPCPGSPEFIGRGHSARSFDDGSISWYYAQPDIEDFIAECGLDSGAPAQ